MDEASSAPLKRKHATHTKNKKQKNKINKQMRKPKKNVANNNPAKLKRTNKTKEKNSPNKVQNKSSEKKVLKCVDSCYCCSSSSSNHSNDLGENCPVRLRMRQDLQRIIDKNEKKNDAT